MSGHQKANNYLPLAIVAIVAGLISIYNFAEFGKIREPNWLNDADVDRWRAARSYRDWLAWGGLIVAVVVAALSYRVHSTESLSDAAKSLGDMRGKSKGEITDAFGRVPNVVTTLDNGNRHATWSSPDYSITLLFEGETCKGVVQEVRT